MAALPEQVQPRDIRRAHVEVAARELLVDDETLQLATDRRPVGQPQREARTDPVVDSEKLQVLAELLVVAELGLFQELHVVLELARRRPGGAVDAGQLGLLLVAAPVSARHPQQLESLQVPGRAHMRAAAKVQEVPGAIDAHLVALHLVGDELELVVLPPPAKLFGGLLAGHRLVHEWDVRLGELAHARFDRGQVGLGDRFREGEVVVETVLHRRTDAVAGVGVELGHGGGEEVRGRVPQRLERIAG